MIVAFAPDTALPARVLPACNHDVRALPARLLLLHYTGMADGAAALRWLACAESRVSCHYFVGPDGAITQLVPEARRAWHAGAGEWAGCRDVNSASIGIEIDNPGHEFGYRDFPSAQIAGVLALGLDICRRHGMPPRGVLAHSDTAPRRKRDPGERFPWGWLAAQGLGHWVEPAASGGDAGLAEGDHGPGVMALQRNLRSYGYGVEATGLYDAHTALVVTAFQRHFRPERVDGRADAATCATLARLIAAA